MTTDLHCLAALATMATPDQLEAIQRGINAAHNYDLEQDCGLEEAGLVTDHGGSSDPMVLGLVKVALQVACVNAHRLADDIDAEIYDRAEAARQRLADAQ